MSRITHRALVLLALGAGVLALLLTGCAPAATNPVVSTPSPGVGTLKAATAYQYAWKVEGGGRYATGSTDVCNLYGTISIEDQKALSNPDNVPIFGFVLDQGTITYGTVWPTAEPGTGIVSGTGSYVVDYDSSGEPVRIRGTAKLTWHDASTSPAISTRYDSIVLTFAKESRAAGKCDF